MTIDEQTAQIEIWQAQKAERRASKPKKRRLLKYGWSTTGVNKDNKADWMTVILRKNPWMDDNLFYNSLESKHLRSIGEEVRG